MIYRLTFRCDEVENFKRVFEASSDATFFDLHKAILASAKYDDSQITSFFMCNDEWEKEQEVTLVEMDKSFEYDNMVMEYTRLGDLLTEPKQRLIYIFDPMFERYFFGSLSEIKAGNCSGVVCVESTGKAPKQIHEIEEFKPSKSGNEIGLDEDFFGSDGYNEDELDMEGFQDIDPNEEGGGFNF